MHTLRGSLIPTTNYRSRRDLRVTRIALRSYPCLRHVYILLRRMAVLHIRSHSESSLCSDTRHPPTLRAGPSLCGIVRCAPVCNKGSSHASHGPLLVTRHTKPVLHTSILLLQANQLPLCWWCNGAIRQLHSCYKVCTKVLSSPCPNTSRCLRISSLLL